MTSRVTCIVAVICREKEKLKEREDAWLKIDELARKNPNVSTLDCQITKEKINNQLWGRDYVVACFHVHKNIQNHQIVICILMQDVVSQVNEAFIDLVWPSCVVDNPSDDNLLNPGMPGFK